MTIKIIEGQGWDRVKFGSSRENTHAILGQPESRKMSDPARGKFSDVYFSIGAILHFDDEEKLEAIEFFAPATPLFNGIDLLDMSFEDARSLLLGVDSKALVHGTGIDSLLFGVSLYFPFGEDEPDAKPEGVMIFRRGYFDRDRPLS